MKFGNGRQCDCAGSSMVRITERVARAFEHRAPTTGPAAPLHRIHSRDAILPFAGLARRGGTEFACLRAAMLVPAIVAAMTLHGPAARAQCPPGWLPGFGSPGLNGPINAFAIMPNGDLVAGGTFTAAGGVAVNRIARWNGIAWSAMGSGMDGTVSSLAILPSGTLVAGGTFNTADGVLVRGIARWNGTAWSGLGSGMSQQGWVGVVPGVYALAVLPGGDLVAAGFFRSAGGVSANSIARWNGATWSALGTGMNGPFPLVSALAWMPNGDLVAGGSFETAGGLTTNSISRWDGTSWFALGTGVSAPESINALAVMPDGALVAGGSFLAIGGMTANRIARWNGTAWAALGTGMRNGVQTMTVLPTGDLAAAGPFLPSGGGATVYRVRTWNGTGWAEIGTMRGGPVNVMTVLPDGTLAAGGGFASGDGAASAYLARYTFGAPAPTISTQPRGTTACAAATAALSLTASGAGPFSYRWRKNGGLIDTITDPTAATAMLLLTDIEPSDAGVYDCVVTTACGSVTSDPATLTVCACLACPADFNLDGGIDGMDVGGFFGAWETGNCDADVNADGGVDGADVDSFFAAWEAGGCG